MLGVAQYATVAIGLGKMVILSRLVDPAIFGVVALAATYVSFLSIFRLDLRPVVVTGDTSPARLSTQFALELASALAGALLAMLAYAVAPGLCSPACWAAIAALMAARIVGALTSTPLYLLERDLRHDVISRLTVIGAALGLLSSVTLAALRLPLAALLADAAALLIVPGLGAWLITRWRPALRWDRAVSQDIWAFGMTLWTTGLLGKIVYEFDDWLIGTFRGEAALGFYSRAYNLAKLPLDVFGGVIAAVSMPLYARSMAAGAGALAQAYRLTTWLLARVVFLTGTIMLAASDELIVLMLGRTWLPVAPLLRLMSLFVLGRPLFQNNGILLTALREEKPFRRLTLLQAVLLLVLGPPVVLRWGEAGISVVVSLMMGVGLAVSEWYTSQRVGVAGLRDYALPVLLGLTLTPALIGLGRWLEAGLIVSLLVKGLLGGSLFAAAILLLERRRVAEAVALVTANLLTPEKASGEDSA